MHLNCTNLTLQQFQSLTDSEKPFYCDKCLFGELSSDNQELSSHSSDLILSALRGGSNLNLSPNSIFKDNVACTEYYTIDDLNRSSILPETQSGNQNFLLVHINAVSLRANCQKIENILAELKHKPSIIFISETKINDTNVNFVKPLINIDGYSVVLSNSTTNAGGTAIYVSNTLMFVERPDINFNFPNCEECSCDTRGIVSVVPGVCLAFTTVS